jgi:hypothetical protein
MCCNTATLWEWEVRVTLLKGVPGYSLIEACT